MFSRRVLVSGSGGESTNSACTMGKHALEISAVAWGPTRSGSSPVTRANSSFGVLPHADGLKLA